MRWTIVLLVLCATIGKSVDSLRCYSCSFTSVDSDQSVAECLTISNATGTVECPYEYCTIFRQEFIDPPGVIASFLRGCLDRPDYLNHDVEDFNFRSYYRACTIDLCNVGDGIQSVVGGSLRPNPLYEGENLLVPGTGGGASAIKTSIFILLLTVLLNYILI